MKKSVELASPTKWHGGKHYLARRIIGLMPPRCHKPNSPADDDPGWLHYVEPYAGGLSVLLANDPEGISEVVNDINADLTNFWRVLQSPSDFESFSRILQGMPFSLPEFKAGSPPPELMPIEAAVRFFVDCRQSLAGRMDHFAPLTKNRTRRGMNEQVSAWFSAVDGLPDVHARLRRVVVLNQPALQVIASQDGKRSLFYLDPPYMHEVRATTGEYAHEMTREDHADLCDAIRECQGRVLLSGYQSDLYAEKLERHGWKRHEFTIANHAAGGKSKRRMVECVWTNY